MHSVSELLKEAGIFYLATCDGGQPRVRPLGLHLSVDGRVLFGVGDFKDVYRQLVANPLVQIAATRASDMHWLRFTGRAVFESDPKYAAMALEAMPQLKKIYNGQTGHRLMMFHLEDATAVEIPMMGEGTPLELV